MKYKLKNIIAIGIGILPVNILMIWYRLTHSEIFSTHEMLLYPVLFGGLNILLILALNKYLLKNRLSSFNAGNRSLKWDILSGLILAAVYFALMFLERSFLGPVLPSVKPPSPEVINLMTDLARNPLLLAIWLGPVVWIGVALFEELVRVFFMICLWSLSQSRYWQYLVILIVAFIIGLTHLYQGPFGIVSVTIQGLVMGTFYYKFRRIWPLIISHALYDSFQIVMFVVQVS